MASGSDQVLNTHPALSVEFTTDHQEVPPLSLSVRTPATPDLGLTPTQCDLI